MAFGVSASRRRPARVDMFCATWSADGARILAASVGINSASSAFGPPTEATRYGSRRTQGRWRRCDRPLPGRQPVRLHLVSAGPTHGGPKNSSRFGRVAGDALLPGRQAGSSLLCAPPALEPSGRAAQAADPVDGDLWLVEGLADRRYAASLCAGCAALVDCDQAAGEARRELGCSGWP
jgi:hypothetical protein